ncbi:MAG: hypothetical protein WDZ51_08885 [Pirellulaceae bacterium]
MASLTHISTWLIRKGPLWMLALLLVFSLGALVWVGGRHWVRTRAWHQVIESPANELEARLESFLRQSQNPGQDLARAISHERLDLSLTGIKALRRRLDQWRDQPAVEFRQHLAECVIHLARRPESHSPDIFYPLAEQLRRINHWHLDLPPKVETRFTVALEKLIRQEAYAEREPGLAFNPPPTTASSATAAWNPPVWEQSSLASSTDLPPSMAQVEREPPRSGSSRLNLDAPRANGEALINPPDRLPGILVDSPAAPRAIEDALHADTPHLPPLENVPLFDLVWKLRDRQEVVAQAAEVELRRRGFTDAHLDLALEITQPNALARTAVVRRIPTIPGIQTTAWLYLMTKDPDETVRYLATAILMTSRDPRLQKQIRADLATDPSPRVRELISR